MGVEKIRRRLNVAGQATIDGDVGLQRSAANFLAPLSGDYVGVNHGTVAVGTANLGTANLGAVGVGFSGGSAQFGFVVNGTCFVMEGTVGGNMMLRADPAGA